MRINQRYLSHRLILIAALILMATGCTTITPVKVDVSPPLAGKTFSHIVFDRVLGKFVDQSGNVDYQALKDDPAELQAYYQLTSSYSPDSHPEFFPDDHHRLAYWINAYNAGAITIVLDYYPISSVLDVKNPAPFFFLSNKAGFFLFQRLSFGGKTTSLYYLENSVIRKRFEEPRIHFALNCASIGCPRLPKNAFSGQLLDRQLDRETRLFLREPRNFRIDHKEKTIYISSIFKWYEKDFTNWLKRHDPDNKADLLNYIKRYLAPEKAQSLDKIIDGYALKFIPYDWGLNDQHPSH